MERIKSRRSPAAFNFFVCLLIDFRHKYIVCSCLNVLIKTKMLKNNNNLLNANNFNIYEHDKFHAELSCINKFHGWTPSVK